MSRNLDNALNNNNISVKNRVVNGDFTINQRAQTSYVFASDPVALTATEIFTLDRFSVYNTRAGGQFTVTQGELNGYKTLRCTVDAPPTDLSWDGTNSRYWIPLKYSFEGQKKEEMDTMESLKIGAIIAIFLIFVLLAVPFKSYLQPFIIMTVIPFGLIGAVAGHILMGYTLSIMSILGIVALAGVVVNDSLVMVVSINRDTTEDIHERILKVTRTRFRPIILTSVTTFAGLLPMIFEKSLQAKFLIPMAISLGFGVMFATLITLVLIPVIYFILEDLRG